MSEIERSTVWCLVLSVALALCVYGHLTLESIRFGEDQRKFELVSAAYLGNSDSNMAPLARWQFIGIWALTLGTALGVFAATQISWRKAEIPEISSGTKMKTAEFDRFDSQLAQSAPSKTGPPPLPLAHRSDDEM